MTAIITIIEETYLGATGAGAFAYPFFFAFLNCLFRSTSSKTPKYKTKKEALEAWTVYCLAQHAHPNDFISGSIYEPAPSKPKPRSQTPVKEKRVAIQSPATASSPSSLPTRAPLTPKRELWAVHTHSVNEIVSP